MSVALVAGEGALPVEITRRMALRGEKPVVYAMRTDLAPLVPYAGEILPLVGVRLENTLKDMLMRGVRHVILAGVAPKTLMYDKELLDGRARDFLAQLERRDDHTLLGGIVALLEQTGLTVISYKDIIADMMAQKGWVAGREPSESEWADVRYGMEILSVTVPLSFGQSVAVSWRSVVAIEAMEGTDEMITRAGRFSRGGVVVKRIKERQDERYDLPTVGTDTLLTMASAGLTCLAIQAGWTVVIDPEKFRELALEKNIAVVGVDY